MMNRLIRNLMKGWDLGRIVRMLSGLLLFGYGLYAADPFFVTFGVMFVLMALLNWSCCASCGCGTSSGGKAVYKDFVKPYEATEHKK